MGVTTPFTGLTTTVNSLSSGTTYYFKIRAQNAQGWGDYSASFAILAAEKPSQMSAVGVTDNSDTTVRVAWSAATANGSPVTKYRIQLVHSDGTTTSENTSACDGSDATVISNLYCDIQMSVFTSSPYSLTRGTLIKATVEAYNVYGYSTASA